MGRTLIRCDLTVTQNNNSIKGRIMAKAAVKNLMFSNQEKEIKAVRSQQRSEGQPKGRAGPQRAARYHCPWGDPATEGAHLRAGGTGTTREPAAAPTQRRPWHHHSQLSNVPAPWPRRPGREKHRHAPGAGQASNAARPSQGQQDPVPRAHRSAPRTEELRTVAPVPWPLQGLGPAAQAGCRGGWRRARRFCVSLCENEPEDI